MFINNGFIFHKINGKSVPEHSLVYEEHFKCCILRWAATYHKNGIRTDNRVENLELRRRGTTRRVRHTFDMNGKWAPIHRRVYQQHYKCCLLRWADIFHKNGIRSDNRIENLEPGKRGTRQGSRGIPKNRRCEYCHSSKTYIEKNGQHSWSKRPDGDGYICRYCYNKRWRNLSRITFQKHNKCCILPWAGVFHKNGNKKDIRIDNLELRKRGSDPNHVVPTDRQCRDCLSFYNKGSWTNRPGGYLCGTCLWREKDMELKLCDSFDRMSKVFHKMQDPNFIRIRRAPRKCAVCGSTKTGKKRTRDWYKLGDQYQCSSCYTKDFGARKRREKNIPSEPFLVHPHDLRHCVACGSTATHKKRNGCSYWLTLKVPIGPTGFLCLRCYGKRRTRIKRLLRKPVTMTPFHLRHCIHCGSNKTRNDSRGNPNWLKVGDLYQCSNCYSKQNKKKNRKYKKSERAKQLLIIN